MHIDHHVLQAIPFSNPNRDALNQPKTVYYGEAERSRISPQSTKRDLRIRVEDRMQDWAVRTRRVPQAVAVNLQKRGWPATKAKAAGQALIKAAGVKGLAIGDEGNTTSMLFLPANALERLTDLAENNHAALLASAKDAKANPELVQAITEILTSVNPSIAAFGRMLADSAASTVDGPLAVASSMTTHATVVQPDFFTAADDLPGDDPGTAHLDTAAYTAGVFYRYASLNTGELAANLKGDVELAKRTSELLLEEMTLYAPRAKKNSTAPFTPPALVYITVRDDRPVSLASAFEEPVKARRESGWLAPSITALNQHVKAVNTFYGTAHLLEAVHTGTMLPQDDDTTSALGRRIESLPEFIQAAIAAAYTNEGE